MHAEFLFNDPPFAFSHAATIASTSRGLIAAGFIGGDERNPDVGIWLSRHEGGGWSQPREIATGLDEEGRRYACWNPVLFWQAAIQHYCSTKLGRAPGVGGEDS